MFRRAPALVLAWVLCGAAGASGAGADAAPPAPRALRIAVLPVDNATGVVAPVDAAVRIFEASLAAAGVELVPDADLEQFLAERRIRYTGGFGVDSLQALRQRLSADAAVYCSAQLWSPDVPPRVAFSARLVETLGGGILWADGIALAGEERPGILGLHEVADPLELEEVALRHLAASLTDSLDRIRAATGGDPAAHEFAHPRRNRALRPQRVYRSETLALPGDPAPIVAVLPFENLAGKNEADRILSDLFVVELAGRPGIAVIDPGEVREALLRNRLIQESGISLAQTDLLRLDLQAKLVVTGQVLAYDDYAGDATPRVAFAIRVIDTEQRLVVWSCLSTHRGDDTMGAFEIHRLRSARALAAGMIRAAVDALARGDPGGREHP